tara:strand:+ start:11531 stop:11890 length:360 start_codon:yes stop_codon:yes gene_type:complete
MMDLFKNWLRKRRGDDVPAPVDLHKSAALPVNRLKKPARPAPAPQFRPRQGQPAAKVEDAGPGKNVLIRNKFVREDTGTHETLKILDDSLVDSGEEPGIDPYNTGGFDRSKNWNNRFRK